MIRFFYNLLFPLVFLVLVPGYLRRMLRRGNYRAHFWQRLGFYSADLRGRLAGPTRPWVEAVSVGEMLVALKLIDALRARDPSLTLVLSTTTTTGYQLACERAPANVEIVYTPVDSPGAVRRAFEVLRPSQLIIVDGGLWPNQLWETRRRRIPTALVNARLSPRSERRFRRLTWLASSMFGLLDLVAVSEPGDLVRWTSLGVPRERLHCTGSVKFDDAGHGVTASAVPRDAYINAGFHPDAPTLLAASTHPGEERAIAEVYTRLRESIPALQLIIAPRHVERCPEIVAEMNGLGLAVVRRSAPNPVMEQSILLLDTTGELRDWYALASVVFVGKSLLAIGGQNPAEVIAASRPVIFGPHMENFADLTGALLAARGAAQVRDAVELESTCRRLLTDPTAAATLVANGREQLAAHRGAAARTAELLLAQAKKFPC